MIAFLTARYWAERGRTIRENERRRGWNWAAGELLAGAPMDKVENWAQQARDFDHETAFDEGVFDAVKEWDSVPREDIGLMLNECMERAVANGANSVSMPDGYVRVAAWLGKFK